MITWITPVGNLAPIIAERRIQNIPISATSTVGPITYSVIAGSLPRGMRLFVVASRPPTYVTFDNLLITFDNLLITFDNDFTFINIPGNNTVTGPQTLGFVGGSPTEVRKTTTSRFVIRANDGVDIEDRTFSITVDGADIPEWITREGFLPVGEGNSLFVLDNSRVDYQLQASDTDVIVGDVLEYRLVATGGELPPGLSLSTSGLISGFTDPIFALEYLGFYNGGYDTAPWDITPLDFTSGQSNGFDTFIYDNQTYDYSEPVVSPRRLSRIYNFVVAVSDGVYSVNRLFKIFVVTEEFLQNNNNIVQIDANVFQTDSSFVRKPLWITNSNLGRIRANNYVTVFLEVYNPPELEGTIAYFMLATNPGTYQLKSTGEIILNGAYEISGTLPFFPISDRLVINANEFDVLDPETENLLYPDEDGENLLRLTLDSITGQLAGSVPYQAAVARTYKFTVLAINYPVASQSYNIRGDWQSTTAYQVDDAVRFNRLIYICVRQHIDQVPGQGEEFWILIVESAAKTFTMDIIGEIDGGIEWLSVQDLGTIKPNQPSQVSVNARSLKYGGRVVYELVSGKLPPGLQLYSTGIIQGKVRQFGDSSTPGLTRFYDMVSNRRDFSTTFDGNTTTFDRKFEFAIKARDSANVAESVRTFSVTVLAQAAKTFANLYVKAFQVKEKRLEWYNFITDADVFRSKELYRPGDVNFGIQTNFQMLVYAGIESVEATKYVQAMSRNHNRKRLLFGDLQIAVAKDPTTQEPLYEVIYVTMVDEHEKNGKSISQTVQLSNTIESKVLTSYNSIKIDSDILRISNSDHQQAFPNSIKNMRKRIQGVGERDREFLPLWMRSIQPAGTAETGFVKALVLCYANPGQAATILIRINNRIRNEGFDFKMFDFTADRYVIDIIDGEIQDQYLAFPQRDILNKLPMPDIEAPPIVVETRPPSVITIDSGIVTFDSGTITFDNGFIISNLINTIDNTNTTFDNTALTFDQGQ